MDNRKCPNKCLRGIPNENFIKGKTVLPEAFQFDPNNDRDDEFLEASINWYDDEGAMEEIHNQTRRDDSFKYVGGAAVISMTKVKRLLYDFLASGEFAYERKAIEDEDGKSLNPYHGNFLVKTSVEKHSRAFISSGLSFSITSVEPNPHF